ncbi:hypothetical protein DCM91_06850 [Chitinophaga costaii]|nr:hypothetical protein DCM91_06850 [Chitinophaga costaii]
MAMKPGPHASNYDFQEKHAVALKSSPKKPKQCNPRTAVKRQPPHTNEAAPSELQQFNEASFTITRWQYGDLDADNNKRDALILLTDTQEADSNYRDLTLKPRTVKLLIRGANGKLREVMKNNHCLANKEEGGASGIDPF